MLQIIKTQEHINQLKSLQQLLSPLEKNSVEQEKKQSPNYTNLLTEQAKQVLSIAKEEAEHFKHHHIGPEHLLLGLLRVDHGVASEILHRLGVELEGVVTTIEIIVGRGSDPSPSTIALSTRGKMVMEKTTVVAHQLGHKYVDTEHILRGLLEEGGNTATGILVSLAIDLEELKQETLAAFKQQRTAEEERLRIQHEETPIAFQPEYVEEQSETVRPKEDSSQSEDEARKTQSADAPYADFSTYTIASQSQKPHQNRKFSRRLLVIGLVGASFATCYSFGRFMPFLSSRSNPVSANESGDHPHYVLAVAWAPDGKRIAFSGGDYSHQIVSEPVVIRSIQTQDDIVAYQQFGPVCAMAWSSKGKYIASISEDGSFLLWDTTRKTLSFTFVGESSIARMNNPCLAWSPNENHIIIMTLIFQTKFDWLVRCKMRHAEKETEAVYSRL